MLGLFQVLFTLEESLPLLEFKHLLDRLFVPSGATYVWDIKYLLICHKGAAFFLSFFMALLGLLYCCTGFALREVVCKLSLLSAYSAQVSHLRWLLLLQSMTIGHMSFSIYAHGWDSLSEHRLSSCGTWP